MPFSEACSSMEGATGFHSNLFRNFYEVLFIAFWNDHCVDPSPARGEELPLDAADREHLTSQG